MSNTSETPNLQPHHEAIDDEIRAELKEAAFFYGGWDELRKVIKELEDNDKEAAWERHTSRY